MIGCQNILVLSGVESYADRDIPKKINEEYEKSKMGREKLIQPIPDQY